MTDSENDALCIECGVRPRYNAGSRVRTRCFECYKRRYRNKGKDSAGSIGHQGEDATEAIPLEAYLATERVQLALRRMATDVVAIGQDLIRIKNLLPHGRWLSWLADNFEMSEDSAERFMQVAKGFEGRGNDEFRTVRNLPLTALYALMAPQAKPVRETVIQQIEAGDAGEAPTSEDVKRLIREALAANQQEIERERQFTARKQAELEQQLDAAQKKAQDLQALKAKAEQDLQAQMAQLDQHVDEKLSAKHGVLVRNYEVVMKERDKLQKALRQMQRDMAERKTPEAARMEWRKQAADYQRTLDVLAAQSVTWIQSAAFFEDSERLLLDNLIRRLEQTLQSFRAVQGVTSRIVNADEAVLVVEAQAD